MNPLKEDIANEVLNIVSFVTKVPVEDIKSKVRKQNIVSARQMYCAYMVDQNNVPYTLSEIGSIVSIDHSSVLHNKKITKDYCATEPQFRNNYERICELAGTSEVINRLIKKWLSAPKYLTREEILSAIEITESKIKVLIDWLARHHENSYRTKVLMDVRDCNRELNAKWQQLEEFELDNQLSKS